LERKMVPITSGRMGARALPRGLNGFGGGGKIWSIGRLVANNGGGGLWGEGVFLSGGVDFGLGKQRGGKFQFNSQ